MTERLTLRKMRIMAQALQQPSCSLRPGLAGVRAAWWDLSPESLQWGKGIGQPHSLLHASPLCAPRLSLAWPSKEKDSPEGLVRGAPGTNVQDCIVEITVTKSCIQMQSVILIAQRTIVNIL